MKPKNPLRDEKTAARLVAATRLAHARMVLAARKAVAGWERTGDVEGAMGVKGPGVGDWTYELDAVTDRYVNTLARDLGKIAPVRVLCEGIGETTEGGRDPVLRVLVDPIDGTRNLMVNLRSAWVLTGFALESQRRPPTTADLELSLQTEIPTLDRRHRVEFLSRRGRGCELRTFAVSGRQVPKAAPWKAPSRLDPRRGYFSFLRYLPSERPALARIEADFFARATEAFDLDDRQVYDDQWISAAGLLTLVSSGKMRMCADLRAWLAAKTGERTVASHPYDLCAWLTATEAGSPVLTIDKGLTFPELDAPLDLTTDVSFVAFANRSIRDRMLPVLREVLRAFRVR